MTDPGGGKDKFMGWFCSVLMYISPISARLFSASAAVNTS